MKMFGKISWLVVRNATGFVAVSVLIILVAFLPLVLTIKAGQVAQDGWQMHWDLYGKVLVNYVVGLFHGDLGSIPSQPWTHEGPTVIWNFVGKLLDRSGIVLIPAILLGAVVGVALGASTFFMPKWLRRFFSTSNQLIFSMPDMILIILLQFLAVWIDQQVGGHPVIQMVEVTNRPAIVLPVICVGTPIAAYLFRYTVQACEEAMTREYVRTVQAKGLPRGVIFTKHVLRPALDSVLAVIPKMVAIATSSLLLVERLVNILGVTSPFSGLGVHAPMMAGLMATILISLAALVFVFGILTSLLRLWVNPVLRKG